MDRRDEIEVKHERLRAIMKAHNADGIMLRQTANIAWFTAGADASIPLASETGAYTILVTPERRLVVTNNIEEPRLRDEEEFAALGFDYQVMPWYAVEPVSTPNMIADADVAEDIQRARWVLLDREQDRLRALGRDGAEAIEEAARAVQPGDTEYDIAARLDAACRRRGGVAIVNLVGVDERISQFRHPLVTGKRLERYAMLVVCMRRYGLYIAATRLVHIGPVPDELRDKLQRIATVDAAVLAASRPGRALGEVFDDLIAAYSAQGEAGQWTLHHQGGLIGYRSRERVATPDDPTVIQAGHATAWNPSIIGCKSEDTALIHDNGFEVVTTTGQWPQVEVALPDGRLVQRPAILEL